jgi:hypothetical protein
MNQSDAIGNHKGDAGKSTITFHVEIIQALVKKLRN